jgi:hypothetical protein
MVGTLACGHFYVQLPKTDEKKVFRPLLVYGKVLLLSEMYRIKVKNIVQNILMSITFEKTKFNADFKNANLPTLVK